MGFFNIFKKRELKSKNTSRQKSSAPRPTTKQKIIDGAFRVGKATKKQVKKTAGNVKANIIYARDYKERVFPIERKGFKKLGTYKPDSWDLKWTIARYRRDGYTLATAKAKNGWGEPVIVLFAKRSKVATKKTAKAPAKKKVTKSKAVAVRGRSRAPAKKKVTKSKVVRGRSRAPETLTIDGMKFHKGGTFGNSREDAANFARRLKEDHGFRTRIKKMNISGESVYAVYFRKGVKKKSKYEAVRGRSRAPEFLTIDGMKFHRGGTFGNSREDAANFAKRLKKDHGFFTRVKKINIYGEPVYAVYYRKGVKKAKRA